MAKPAAIKDAFHDRLLGIVLQLPGAYEDRPWGSVHCKVDGKIFVGWGRLDDGEMSMGIRVDKTFQPMLVATDPRFTVAKYVGKHGGVDMRLGPKPDWHEVEKFIIESYRAIAPKKRIKELEARDAVPATATAAKPKTIKPARSAKPKTTKPARSADPKPGSTKRRAARR